METIQFRVEAGVAHLTLNRPDKLNSFNTQMHAEIRSVLADLGHSHQARALLLTGAGRAFCAGQDLSDRAVAPGGAAVDLGESIEKNYRPLVLALRNLPMPVVAAVNGVAAGAGARNAPAFEVVIAARSARFLPAFSMIRRSRRVAIDDVSVKIESRSNTALQSALQIAEFAEHDRLVPSLPDLL